MDLTNLHTVLEETFSANFVAYYRSHSAHINVLGRNFYADHKLLQKIYEYFQANIDTLGEKLRTTRAYAPDSIGSILAVSRLADEPVVGSAIEYFYMVKDSLEVMIDQYHELYAAAEAVDYIDISNFAQDQIAILAKFRWMVESTLEDQDDQ
jgi:DNA-binding ferritin-like protein